MAVLATVGVIDVGVIAVAVITIFTTIFSSKIIENHNIEIWGLFATS